MRTGFLAGAAIVAFASVAEAAYVIDIGTHNLLPNTAGQTISIYVSRTGSELVSGLDVYAQVGDGGVENGGTDTGPRITNIDLLTGTIISGGAQSDFFSYSDGLLCSRSGDIASPVAAEGKIATLTISTVGISEGVYELDLSNVFAAVGPFNTSFTYLGQEYVAQVTPGLIAVPEPMTVGMAAMVSLSALAVRPRRRHKE